MDDKSLWAIFLALAATALGVALAFEHIGGLKPCALCYRQRLPYYFLIALSIQQLIVLSFFHGQGKDAYYVYGSFFFGTKTAIPTSDQMIKAVGWSPALLYSRLGLIIAFIVLLVSAGMGVHHAGVEWKWWPGPDACAGGGAAADASGSLIERMQAARVVRCDEAAGRFLGLSFAGYNALFSLGLAAFLALHFYFKPNAHNYIAAEHARSEAPKPRKA
ncbi:MAG: disulfide bond formation protein B [Chitinophagales bacterium]|nr:disulfide bond formation protein B [Hyphomicrobiales bacterium]